MKKKVITSIILVMSMIILNSCSLVENIGKGIAIGGMTVLKMTSLAYYAIVEHDISIITETIKHDTEMFNNDRDSKEKLEELLNAIESRNADTVSSLFSDFARHQADSFESSVSELLEYYDGSFSGDFEDVTMSRGPSVNETDEIKIYDVGFEVYTKSGNYRLSIEWVSKDTNNPTNIGIRSLYIIKAEDDINVCHNSYTPDSGQISCGYGGDGKKTVGINIGIQNTWLGDVSDYYDFD